MVEDACDVIVFTKPTSFLCFLFQSTTQSTFKTEYCKREELSNLRAHWSQGLALVPLPKTHTLTVTTLSKVPDKCLYPAPVCMVGPAPPCCHRPKETVFTQSGDHRPSASLSITATRLCFHVVLRHSRINNASFALNSSEAKHYCRESGLLHNKPWRRENASRGWGIWKVGNLGVREKRATLSLENTPALQSNIRWRGLSAFTCLLTTL